MVIEPMIFLSITGSQGVDGKVLEIWRKAVSMSAMVLIGLIFALGDDVAKWIKILGSASVGAAARQH